MKLNFREMAELLELDGVLTYKMRHQLFFSPMGKKIKLWFKPGAAMMLDHSLHMFGEESVLDSFLAELKAGEKYGFFAVPTRYMPLLESHFKNIEREEDCSAYTIDKEDFHAEGEGLDSLNLSDADFVNENWDYKFEGSLDFFKGIIRDFPSSAIRVNNSLAGWALCYDATDDMINLGSLRVLEQHRKQGYGKMLAVDLVKKVLQSGKTPMVHILDNNTASKNLSMSIGFKPYTHKVFWGSGIKI